jgi:hypothetical protein
MTIKPQRMKNKMVNGILYKWNILVFTLRRMKSKATDGIEYVQIIKLMEKLLPENVNSQVSVVTNHLV